MAAPSVYYHPLFLDHDTGNHPETARRLAVVRERLLGVDLEIEWRTPPRAQVADIGRVHTRRHIEHVEAVARAGGGSLDWDTVVSKASYEAALHAAGAGIDAVTEAVSNGRRSFLLVRPPGHHARSDQGMGFCLFNNVAVAAAHALEALDVERVLIVDWDVHHGNGTQELFYDDPRVLFASLHLGNHYPGTGALGELGAGEGLGRTVNLPLPHGSGDGVVTAFFSRVLLPLADAFRPGLVLVSAGYDSVAGDPLGGLRLSNAAYRWMAGSLAAWCRQSGAAGPVLFLEGGYDPGLVAEAVVSSLEGLAADASPSSDLAAGTATREDALLDALIDRLSPHWSDVPMLRSGGAPE